MKKILAIALTVVIALGVALPVMAGTGSKWLYDLLDIGGGTTYYVDSVLGDDSNTGTSQAKAWKTIDKVNEGVYSPGDKILFKSGCTFIGQLMFKGSGNAENGAIIVSSYGNGAQPIINANGTTENDGAVIRLYNQEYIEISDLELTNNSSVKGVRRGVFVIAEDFGVADHIYIRNCNIHDVPTNADKSTTLQYTDNGGKADYEAIRGPSRGAISFSALCGGAMIPTAFNDILVDNNIISKTGTNGTGIGFSNEWREFVDKENSVVQEGANFEGEPAPFFGSTNILVSNNDLKNTAAAIRFEGVDGRVGNGVIAEHNVSYKPDNVDSNSAMWVSHCYNVLWQYNEVYDLDNGGLNDCGAFDADGYCENTIFQYNYTHNNRGEPIMVCNVGWTDYYDYTNTTGSVYRYNISQNDMWGAKANHGRLWVQKGAKNNWFYNNVIYVGEGLGGKNIAVYDTWENHIYNNVFINLSEKTTYHIEVPNETFVENNCFYGYHPESEPTGDDNIVLDLDDTMPLLNPGSGGIGLDTLQGYMQITNSVLKGAGKLIENNGGKDFYGNAVSSTTAPDIGVHQSDSSEDTIAPTAPTSVKTTALGYDSIKVKWDPATDNVGIDHYVIYVNGNPVGRVDGKATEWIAEDLLSNTEYTFLVRTFDANGNTMDSSSVKENTDTAAANELKLSISTAKVYNEEGAPCTNFGANELVAPRFKVVNGNGVPIKNALVTVLVSADSQSDYMTVTDMTDENGIAQTGFYSDTYRGEKTVVDVKVQKIEKEGYTYKAGNITSVSFNVTGADESYYANLVKNNDFNDIYEGTTIPKNWGVATGAGLDAIRVVEGVGPDGSNALEFSEKENFTSMAIQNFSNLPNGVYTLTYYVKNTATGSSVTMSGYGDSITESIPVSPKWQQISVSDINVTTGNISLQFDIKGSDSTLTYLDKVELSQNLMTNTHYKSVHPYSKIPSDYYYTTEDGTIGEDASNINAMLEDTSIKALSVAPYYASGNTNAIRIGNDEAFKLTIGQNLKNVAEGVYTIKVDAINSGGIKAYIAVKDYGGKEIVKEIEMSSGFKSTKINNIKVTSKMAVVELRFEGMGDINEYIYISGLSFSARSDYPTAAAAITFAGDNLLLSQNPSFEEDGMVTPSLPTNWLNVWDAGSVSAIATDEEAHTGKYSCKIELNHDRYLDSNISGAKNSSLDLKPNSYLFTDLATGYYTFSAWIKGDYAVKVNATANGSKSYEKYSTITDEWHKVEIKDMLVTNGQLSIGFYNAKYEKDEFKKYVAYLDDVELYLQEEYLSNTSFESGISTGWKVTENKGYSTVKSTSSSNSGSKAARIVLPGTPSTASLATTASLINMQSGLYKFSTYIRGTSVVELYIKSDGKEEVVESCTATDEWQQVDLSVNINDSVKEMGIRVVNPDKTTSSYVTVDDASFIRCITAADVATTVGDLKPIEAGVNKITMPTVRDGFTITLIKSSHPSIIDLNGNVTTPPKDTTVTLSFKIVNNSDPSDIAVVDSLVKVLAFESEEDENAENGAVVEDNDDNTANPPDNAANTDVNTDADADADADEPDVSVKQEETKPKVDSVIEQITQTDAFTINWLVFVMFILAILSVLGFTFTVMLAMKKKAQARRFAH